MDCAARLVGGFENAVRLTGQFVLAQRLADVDAAGGKERVGHAAAYDQMINLAD